MSAAAAPLEAANPLTPAWSSLPAGVLFWREIDLARTQITLALVFLIADNNHTERATGREQMTNTAIEYLTTDLGLDTRSTLRAVQDAGALDFDVNTYRKIIGELTGSDDVNISDDYARVTFKYLVEGIMTDNPDLSIAEAKAIAYVDSHPWVNAKPEYEYQPKSTVDALGNPKQKKGAKKDAAIAFWNANQDKNWTRKQWIAQLSEEIGLTTAGASTYHYNLKNGIYK